MADLSERNQKPEQTPSSELTPVESTKKQFKTPPGLVDVTSKEPGVGYVIVTGPPPVTLAAVKSIAKASELVAAHRVALTALAILFA